MSSRTWAVAAATAAAAAVALQQHAPERFEKLFEGLWKQQGSPSLERGLSTEETMAGAQWLAQRGLQGDTMQNVGRSQVEAFLRRPGVDGKLHKIMQERTEEYLQSDGARNLLQESLRHGLHWPCD
eukprot:gene1278-2720_t